MDSWLKDVELLRVDVEFQSCAVDDYVTGRDCRCSDRGYSLLAGTNHMWTEAWRNRRWCEEERVRSLGCGKPQPLEARGSRVSIETGGDTDVGRDPLVRQPGSAIPPVSLRTWRYIETEPATRAVRMRTPAVESIQPGLWFTRNA